MKWRRAEDQLTDKQRATLTSMLIAGYSNEACMERFGLTHQDQVTKFYTDNVVRIANDPVPGDRVPTTISFRTTSNEVIRGLGSPVRRVISTRNRHDSFDN